MQAEIKLLHHCRRCRHPAQPQTWGQELGEAVEANHSALCVDREVAALQFGP